MTYKDLTDEIVGELLENHNWQSAKSKKYEEIPHAYTVMGRHGWNKNTFKAIARYISENGVDEKFYSKTYRYFYWGKYKYWHCDDDWRKTILINRADKNKTYP